ncbi:hypothetical protein U9M48_029971 [Paspalum notatum var. saurae]|uniref:Uncharacterized protein n=1 Tax=Paspalum notatum var. saurae TaxID=547442 RepID=A0AAQ3TZI3_PASNO
MVSKQSMPSNSGANRGRKAAAAPPPLLLLLLPPSWEHERCFSFSLSRCCWLEAAAAWSPSAPLRHDSRFQRAPPAAEMSAGEALRIEKASTLSMAIDRSTIRLGETNSACWIRRGGWVLVACLPCLLAQVVVGQPRPRGFIYARRPADAGKMRRRKRRKPWRIGLGWVDGSRRFARRAEAGGPRNCASLRDPAAPLSPPCRTRWWRGRVHHNRPLQRARMFPFLAPPGPAVAAAKPR